VTILSAENAKSKIVSEKMAQLSDFMVYQSNTSYTVIITAINSQGSSEPNTAKIGMCIT